ncbi:MAG TPA: hypothetical protein VHN16_01715, partial [Streptosporangiaceae bacterium]|nr:hypothetical protein [Streptosporangiaceae bacterium]
MSTPWAAASEEGTALRFEEGGHAGVGGIAVIGAAERHEHVRVLAGVPLGSVDPVTHDGHVLLGRPAVGAVEEGTRGQHPEHVI